jgi:4-hydroxy-3-methylbut-2-en-1-yl diphosphate synthase IspG/GcpE
MNDQVQSALLDVNTLGPNVQEIVAHLCTGDCHAYGSVLQWCETRGDCVYAVVCPGCARQFLIDEDDLAELERWTEANGHALVCGIQT